MSFRRRLVIAGVVAAWIPVLFLGLFVRHAGVRRLTDANERRMQERGDRLAESWVQGAAFLEDRLAALRLLLVEDNTARIAVRLGQDAVLRETVARFASSSGLGVTYVLDSTGTILAASHFPGDAGRHAPALAVLADREAAPVLTRVSLPASDRVVLALAGRFDVGGVEVVGIVGEELAALGVAPVSGNVSLLAEEGEGAGAVLVAGA